jgi:hypothetical protein
MNERQQAYNDYFLGRVEYSRGNDRDEATVGILAARGGDHMHPLGASRKPPLLEPS